MNKNNTLDTLEIQIQDILDIMTLKEKVGQLTMIELSRLMTTYNEMKPDKTEKGALDEKYLQEVIVDYGIGSILSGGNGAPLNSTVEAWTNTINKIQEWTLKSRLKIPILYGIDGVHGFDLAFGATIYPHNIGIAAARNLQLIEEYAKLTAEELNSVGITWNFAPVLDVARDPRWGRTYETFGEDPYLTSEMGKAFVLGLQENNKVAACGKHYVGYGSSQKGKDRGPIDISLRTLWEICLPPFKAAIESGLDTIMATSAEVNGTPVHASKTLLTDILRDKLKFNGVVISDWMDIEKLHVYHKTAIDISHAIKQAYSAGIDVSTVPFELSQAEQLVKLVEQGEIPMNIIDESVKRVLRLKFKLGLFNERFKASDKAQMIVGSKKSRDLAEALATESMTLLKNKNHLLPLSKEIKSVLIVGPSANSLSQLCGGWTMTWRGGNEDQLTTGKTVLDAIKEKVSPNTEVTFIEDSSNIIEIKSTAEKVEVCIAIVGEEPYAEGSGDRRNLNLSKDQLELLEILHDSQTPVVMVLVSGRPLTIKWESQNLPAILWAYLPGTEGGSAIANVLFGDHNPSGRLPITIPKDVYQLPLVYNTRINSKYEPLYPFGYGLSYTKFKYSHLDAPSEVKQGESINVSVKVKNIGNYDGDEIVELYISESYAPVTLPLKQLKGFKRVSLKQGEEKTVSFQIMPEQLCLVNDLEKIMVESRVIKIKIGDQSKQIILTTT